MQQEESKHPEGSDSDYSMAIDLSLSGKLDKKQLVIFHVPTQKSFPLPIGQGVVFTQDLLAKLAPDFIKDVPQLAQPSNAPLGFIFPELVNKLITLKASSIDPLKGLYLQVEKKYQLPQGRTLIGMPAGIHSIEIVRDHQLFNITIDCSQFPTKLANSTIQYNFDTQKKPILFVRSIPKKLEPGDDQYTMIPAGFSPKDGDISGRHASIVQEGNSFILVDGHQGKPSANGTYIYIPNDKAIDLWHETDSKVPEKPKFRFAIANFKILVTAT